MKYTNILKLSAIALFSLCASCGDKHDDHAGHDHAEGEHDKADKKDDHAGHDHNDPDADHTNCNVLVGPKGGRMIEEMAELNLNEAGQLSLEFVNTPSADTKVIILLDSEAVELTKDGNTYTTVSVADKLPAEVHVSIKGDGDPFVQPYKIEAGKCTKCGNAKLACTCNNHDHGDDKAHGDHDDHKGHDHDKKDDHKGHAHGHDHGHTKDGHKHDDHKGHDH